MNLTDRMELNELRAAMWECYQRIARTPDDDHWTRIFIRARDRHQEIISQDGQEIAE